ncbi:(d)CMP kinase [Candidatus Omnitrophota bacterium]
MNKHIKEANIRITRIIAMGVVCLFLFNDIALCLAPPLRNNALYGVTNKNNPFVLTIDGPSGTGKSTVAQALAKRLGAVSFSYGKIYRLITWKALQKKISLEGDITPEQLEALLKAAKSIDMSLFSSREIGKKPRYYYSNEDVTDMFLSDNIERNVPKVSRIPEIRKVAIEKIKSAVKHSKENGVSVILEGRVTGIEIAPDADIKIYMTADLETRAERRAKQIIEMVEKKGIKAAYMQILDISEDVYKDHHAGKTEEVLQNEIIDRVKQDTALRDKLDQERKHMPAVRPSGAIPIDTTNKTLDETVKNIEGIINISMAEKLLGEIEFSFFMFSLIKRPKRPWHDINGELDEWLNAANGKFAEQSLRITKGPTKTELGLEFEIEIYAGSEKGQKFKVTVKEPSGKSYQSKNMVEIEKLPRFRAQYAYEHNKRVKDIASLLVEVLKNRGGLSGSSIQVLDEEKWQARLNSKEFIDKLGFVTKYHDIAAPQAMPKDKREAARKSLRERGVEIEGHTSSDTARYYQLRKIFFQDRPHDFSQEEIDFALDYFQGPNSIHLLEEQGFELDKITRTAILFHHHRQDLDDYLKQQNWTDEEKLDVLILTSIQVAADVIENGLNRFKPLYARNKEPDETPRDTREKHMGEWGIPQHHLELLKDAFKAITDTDHHPALKEKYWKTHEDAKILSKEEIDELDKEDKLPEDLKPESPDIVIEDSHYFSQCFLPQIKRIFSELSKADNKKSSEEIPVVFTIDLTMFTREGEDWIKNAETWAYLILMLRDMKNISFRFEVPDPLGNKQIPEALQKDKKSMVAPEKLVEKLSLLLEEKARQLNIDNDTVSELKTRINQQTKPGAVEVSIWNVEWFKSMVDNKTELRENQLPLAMSEPTVSDKGIAVRNYQTALMLGLAESALKIAQIRDLAKNDGNETEYNRLVQTTNIVERINYLYKIIRDDVDITAETLKYMVHQSSRVRLMRALELHIPPIGRMIELLKERHERIQFFLQSA